MQGPNLWPPEEEEEEGGTIIGAAWRQTLIDFYLDMVGR